MMLLDEGHLQTEYAEILIEDDRTVRSQPALQLGGWNADRKSEGQEAAYRGARNEIDAIAQPDIPKRCLELREQGGREKPAIATPGERQDSEWPFGGSGRNFVAEIELAQATASQTRAFSVANV